MPALIKIKRKHVTAAAPPATTVAADEGEILANLADRKVFVRDAAGVPVAVADRVTPYSATRQYAINDLTIQAAVLYRCITTISVPEAFTPAKWEAIGAAAGTALDGAILIAPNSATRNTITPTGDFPALRVVPAGGQSVALVNINGTQHDRRGIPVGRYGEVVWLVSQASHPFTVVGQPAAYVHPNWVLAQAGNATLSVRAVVHEIIDANNVLLQMSGQVKNLNTAAFVGGVITAGATYFLSSTAGRLSATPDASGAQATLLVTSATTGLLLLSNAAGSAIVSRAPGGQPQTIFEPLSIRNTAGTAGLQITPNAQSITSLGGTPVSLTFQQDGILALGGSLSITGSITSTGNITIANATPQLLLTETDQTSPSGRVRLIVSGADIYLQGLVAEPSTYASIWYTDDDGFNIGPRLTAINGIFDPTLIASAPDTDGSTALTIGIARSWVFGQFGVGAGAGLELKPTAAGKSFRIVDTARTVGILISPATRTLAGIGGALAVSGDLEIGVKVTAASATIGAIDINVTAGVIKRTTGSIIYDVPTSFQHLFRINNAGAATVDPVGTAVPGTLTIITAEKGDARYLKLAGGTVTGTANFSALANFTGGLIAERVRVGVKTIDTIDNLSSSLLFNVPTGSVYAFDIGDVEVARIQAPAATVVGNTLVTVTYGDIRYVRGVGGVLQVDRGGTGGNDPAEARTNLGTNDASNLTAGILPAARLGATSADETWVGARNAGMTANQVGTYGFCSCPNAITPGSNYAGSSLRFAGWRTGGISEAGSTLSGTWKAYGEMSTSDNDCVTLFMRVA